jgi:hypothetical protein
MKAFNPKFTITNRMTAAITQIERGNGVIIFNFCKSIRRVKLSTNSGDTLLNFASILKDWNQSGRSYDQRSSYLKIIDLDQSS